MKYEFVNENINNKWFVVCKNYEHFPMVEKLKSGEYKVVGIDGKSRIEKEYKDAIKFAKETFKKMSKFNRKWNRENKGK